MHTTDTIKDMEITLDDLELVQIGSCVVEISYDFEAACPEERQTMGDPGSPGHPADVEISKIVNSQPLRFECDDFKLTIEDGGSILALFSKQKIESMETEILESMFEEAF